MKTVEPKTELAKRVWLIQRLNEPQHFIVAGKKVDNPFSFGGGYKNGGLSDEAMDILREIFSFDYMGAAEFEFGAVPKALSKMAKDSKDYKKFVMEIPSKKVKDPYDLDKNEKHEWPKSFKVFLFCKESDLEGVKETINLDIAWKLQLKEWTGLDRCLKQGKYPPKTKGWLELDNGFFFFVDEAMCDKVVALFSEG